MTRSSSRAEKQKWRIQRALNYYNMLNSKQWPSPKECYDIKDLYIRRNFRLCIRANPGALNEICTPWAHLRTGGLKHYASGLRSHYPGGTLRVERRWRFTRFVPHVNGDSFECILMAQAVVRLVQERAAQHIMGGEA